MKKVALLLLPFLLLTSFSCSGEGEKVVDPAKINNQDELIDALDFSDLSYLQLTAHEKKTVINYECTPTVYHYFPQHIPTNEYYVCKDENSSYKMVYLENNQWLDKRAEDTEFYRPVNFSNEHFRKMFDSEEVVKPLDYSDLTYDENEKAYHWLAQVKGQDEKVRFTFKFNNKQITSYQTMNEEGDVVKQADFAYQSLEVTPPQSEHVVLTHQLTATNTDHLTFLDLKDEPLGVRPILEENDYSFKIVVSGSGSDDFIIPSLLSIKVNGIQITSKKYSVDPADDFKSALVTISEDVILGDVTITGEARLITAFCFYPVYLDGVDLKHNGLSVDFGAVAKGSKLELDLEPINLLETGYADIDNIVIYVDGEIARLSKEEGADINYKINSYNGKVTLTFSSTYTTNINYVEIIARSNQTSLLEKLTWEEIAMISQSGFAQDIFELGETKTIEIDNVTNVVRIIGFNHDETTRSSLLEPEYAGITFEFVYLIDNVMTPYGTDSSNFLTSTLNLLLNNELSSRSVISRIDKNLKPYIKNVKKRVMVKSPSGVYIESVYPAKLFPLSTIEIANLAVFEEMEGKQYAYYKKESKYAVLKYLKDDYLPSTYWLRSPYDISELAFTINPFATTRPWQPYPDETTAYYGVAPAFCI